MPHNLTQFYHFARRNWLALGLWLLLLLPVGSFLLVSTGIAAYIFWPHKYPKLNIEEFIPTQSQLVLLTHGLKDDANGWVAQALDSYRNNHFDGQVMTLDWSDYALEPIRCAVNGKRIGERIGRAMARGSQLTSVHLVGHSCGAFVIYGACQALKAARPQVQIRTTYLAPVSIYGIFKNYGRQHFGDCADTTLVLVDSEDRVPGNIQSLKHSEPRDISSLRRAQAPEVSPHNWPVVYFQQQIAQGNFAFLE